MLGKRIKQLRTKLNMSQSELGASLNITQQAIARWESGATEPDHLNINRLADLFDVSTDYLLGKTDIPQFLSSTYPPGERIHIPKFGKVKAGFDAIAYDNFEGFEYFDASSINHCKLDDYFCTQVYGDSMNPDLKNGDIVLVRKQSDVDSGKIALVVLGENEATIKKVKKGRDYVELIPCNPAHNSLIVEGDALYGFHIVGVIVELKRKFE